MERTAVYPGSFDPITVGHLDVIERAARLFDRVIVAVMHNPAKKGCFPVAERLRLIEAATAHLPGVTVDAWDGLLAEYVQRTGAACVVRGLRGVADYESEQNMAQVNALLLPGLETVFLTARPEHGCVSSSVVREAASFGADISAFVPAAIAEDVRAHFGLNEAAQTISGGGVENDQA
ncbi:MAG: pantetheine-phosphate adenylyltransferase [Clostridia bacterium]|nr:pantetheine-phosphate adenylyltransferase [Clostridia bacterium]